MKSDALQGLHHVNYKSAYFKSVFLASAPLISGCIIWLWLTVNDDVGHDLGAWLDFAPSALASFLAIETYILFVHFLIYIGLTSMSKNYFLKDPNFVKNIIFNVLISLLSVMPIIIWLNIDKDFYKYATAEMACFLSLFFILIGFFIGLAYHWLLHKTNGVNKQLHG